MIPPDDARGFSGSWVCIAADGRGAGELAGFGVRELAKLILPLPPGNVCTGRAAGPDAIILIFGS